MSEVPGQKSDFERRLDGWRLWSLGVGTVGLAAAVVLLFIHPSAFYHGYLVGFFFWIGASLGCLVLLMLHHLVAGEWGFVSQRILEGGAGTLPYMAVFFIPVFFGMPELYEWVHEDAVRESPLLQHKSAYLNVSFFAVRTIVYFAVWTTLAVLLTRWSAAGGRTRELRYAARMRRLSAGGLIAYMLLMTLASVDWVMSIEPHWFSQVFGWMIQASQVLIAITLVVLLMVAFRDAPAFEGLLRTKHFHDWGNLLLTFVIVWAYLMFSQFMILWSGNVPEEVVWYTRRRDGFWRYVAPAMIGLHFAVPFLLLLFRRVKRRRRYLAGVAALVLAAHLVFVAWLVLPGFAESSPQAAIPAAAASWIGIGGCWVTVLSARLAVRPLVPRFDPRFEEFLTQRSAP